MGFALSVRSGFRNYFNFRGKASRSQFWYWVLFTVLLSLVLGVVEGSIWPAPTASEDWMRNLEQSLAQPTPLTSFASLALLIPNLAVTARRFHDAGYSAKWLLLQIAPLAYGLLATVGAVGILYNVPPGQALSSQDLMSLIFLVVPILALSAAIFVLFFVIALRPSRSFYDGNKYVDPEPLSSMDEGTTA